MSQISSELHEQALKLARGHYETAAEMRDFVLRNGLDRLNRVRPPSIRYSSVEDVFRDFMHAANAVSTFAVNLGLILGEEALQIILDFERAHPELPRDDEGFEIPSE